MDQVWTPLLCVFRKWRFKHVVLWPTCFSLVCTAPYFLCFANLDGSARLGCVLLKRDLSVGFLWLLDSVAKVSRATRLIDFLQLVTEKDETNKLVSAGSFLLQSGIENLTVFPRLEGDNFYMGKFQETNVKTGATITWKRRNFNARQVW